ncbi:MAG: DUF6448 family protein [Acidobacteriota bacterium]
MKKPLLSKATVFLSILALLALAVPTKLLSHCDTLGGPVIKAAQKALETGNVNLVLIWVQPKDEDEIKTAFEKTLAVRKLGPEAKDMADLYFFETLVRVHRAGEGAPYTGLKPEGSDLGPVVPASDKAIEDGSVKALVRLLVDTVQENVPKHFKELMARKKFGENDVEAGRQFVRIYVIFTHYVEGIYEAASGPKEGHAEPAAEHVHE